MTKHLAPYKPLPWQVAPWRDKSPVLLLTGSAGGGKSRVAAEKLHGYCLKYPKAQALMLRKIRQSMTNSTVLFMERTVISNDPRVRHYPSKLRFEYHNGSLLTYGGMANREQREQVRSIGAAGGIDIAWMEEATGFTEDDYNEVLARMRGNAADWRQIILTTNPDAPTHWIYKDLIENNQASIYYSSAADNPHNPDSYKQSLGRLTGILAQRLREGRWVQAEGVIYDEFDHARHVIERDALPRFMPRYVAGVDWGYRNPGVLGVYGVGGVNGALYLVAEYYHTGQMIDWWVEKARALNNEYGIEVFVCDPSEPAYINALNAAGLNAVAGFNAVIPGINAVKQRLADGRLFFVADALRETDLALEEVKQPTATVAEFPGYVWANSKTKEQPIKELDHGMDMLRYLVAYVDDIGQERVVREVSRIW